MKATLLALCLIVTLAVSQASVLVSWNFTSNLTATISTNASSSVASAANATLSLNVSGGHQINATGTNIGPNSGNGTWSLSSLSTVTAYELGDSDVVNGVSGFLNASNFGTSPNSTLYLGFQLTMNSTIAPAFSQLQGIQFNLSNAGASGPRGVQVTYRIGTSGSFTSIGGTAVPNLTANNYGLFTFNLPTPITLSGGDVVEFRLLGYANMTGNSIRLDNVRITAIPEPAAAGLLALSGGVVFWLRRRRAR